MRESSLRGGKEKKIGLKIQELKKKIAAVKPEFPAEHQKLIYCGKILTDGMLVKAQTLRIISHLD